MYKPETCSALMDSLIMAGKVLEADAQYGTLAAFGASRDDFTDIVYVQLEQIVRENGISANHMTFLPDDFDYTDSDNMKNILQAMSMRFDGFDDPEFWYEQEYPMGDIMEYLTVLVD